MPSSSHRQRLGGRDEFLEKYGITPREFQDSRLNWSDLQAVFDDYSEWWRDLTPVGESFEAILRRCPEVHAAKSRPKDPEKLVEKIIRKSVEKRRPWASPSSFVKIVPDLLGVRAIFLFHQQFRPVHSFIVRELPVVRRPKPIAYVQEPMPQGLRGELVSCGLRVKNGERGYQSVHYELRQQVGVHPARVELQARTIYQEAWGEVSHFTAYPYRQKVRLLVASMEKLEKITAKADLFSSVVAAFTELYDARKAGRRPDPDFVQTFINQVRFLREHHPDLAADLMDATSTFDLERTDSVLGVARRHAGR